MSQSLIPSLWGTSRKGEDVFSTLHREIDRVFDDFTHGDHWPFHTTQAKDGQLPLLADVSETDKEIEVVAELPGVEEKDIDVSLADDRLTIKGEKKSESEKKEKGYQLIERSYGSFERSMRLPCEVESDKVRAEFKNGVLKVTLPKLPGLETKTKKIPVKGN